MTPAMHNHRDKKCYLRMINPIEEKVLNFKIELCNRMCIGIMRLSRHLGLHQWFSTFFHLRHTKLQKKFVSTHM